MTHKQTPNSLPKTINTDIDIWAFFTYLHKVDGVAFHPQQNFDVYVNGNTSKPSFTPEEVKKRNDLMDLCWEACNELGFNIYTIGMESMKENLGMDISKHRDVPSDIAVCTLTQDYVIEETGEIVGFCINKFYKIMKEDSIWVSVRFADYEDSIRFTRWKFEKHFRYAEDWEAEGFKEKLWDSL